MKREIGVLRLKATMLEINSKSLLQSDLMRKGELSMERQWQNVGCVWNFGVVEAQILIRNKGIVYGLWKQKNTHISLIVRDTAGWKYATIQQAPKKQLHTFHCGLIRYYILRIKGIPHIHKFIDNMFAIFFFSIMHATFSSFLGNEFIFYWR